jgi:2-polyprenyl-6-methoxyphenol hydroxylase-like FAD-dependent oxidoreductase
MSRPAEPSPLPAATDVLVVGAGPTGLTLACVLASRGVPFVLVDRLTHGASTSRAAVVHARTLEALEALDVTRRLREQGHVVPRFTVRDRDRVLAHVRFDRLPTRHPYTLMVPQQHTEAILLGRLRELGGDVHRGCLVEQVAQDAHGVAVTLATGSGRLQVRARYVVGADGMHSVVREQAGIAFQGDAYEHGFLLADVHMQWPLGRDEVNLFFSPEGLVVVAPLPEGRHRVVATADRAPEHPDRDDVQALLDARGPRRGARVDDVVWSSRFRVHHRLAERYRAGRVLLAGDAAHVHSPAGGQGMNTGIQDAFALGDALVDVVAGRADVERLDRYERVRRPVAQRVVAFTDRMTRMATLRDHRARALRNLALSTVARVPAAPRRLAMELAGLRVPAS